MKVLNLTWIFNKFRWQTKNRWQYTCTITMGMQEKSGRFKIYNWCSVGKLFPFRIPRTVVEKNDTNLNIIFKLCKETYKKVNRLCISLNAPSIQVGG